MNAFVSNGTSPFYGRATTARNYPEPSIPGVGTMHVYCTSKPKAPTTNAAAAVRTELALAAPTLDFPGSSTGG